MAKALIAVLGIGKGTWGHVARLMSDPEQKWGKIILISNEWGKENFKPAEGDIEWVLTNTRAGFDVMKDQIKEKLPSGDIAVSLASGSGKEHMALLAALKESNKKFEIVTLTGQGIKYY
jgi:hypothetical protein